MSASATLSDDVLARAYNDVPYTSAPDPARHPDRLVTLGVLFGIDVAPLESCRVLEMACGDGANLVSMAALLPHATFVGFDIAAQPIERARAMAGALHLSNVTLLTLDLRPEAFQFQSRLPFYFIALGLVAASLIVVRLIEVSRFGACLVAVHENE